MAKSIIQWFCENKVFFEYFCGKDQECAGECINNAIKKILNAYPEHYVYIGITHNPCGRFSGNYGVSPMPPMFEFETSLSLSDNLLLNERAHQEDYEKMFVICYCNDEEEIREKEKYGILSARTFDSKKIINSTNGGNGLLKKKQPYYFLYACITKTKPLLD